MYERLWKRLITVSTLLILPSLREYFPTAYMPGTKVPHSFLGLLWAHGLSNAYKGVVQSLAVLEDCNNERLFLVFERSKATSDVSEVLGYYSMNEYILDSECCEGVYFSNSTYIVYRLSLPEEWKEDYQLILDGKYSKVSAQYKNLLRIKYKRVAEITDPRAVFVITRNLPYMVTVRDKSIQKELETYLGVKLGDDNEFLPKFRKDKESLDLNLFT